MNANTMIRDSLYGILFGWGVLTGSGAEAEEAKQAPGNQPEQSKNTASTELEQIIKEMDVSTKKLLEMLKKNAESTEGFAKRIMDILNEPKLKAEEYNKRVDAYLGMSDEQAYRLGLASILKDPKLKGKHGVVIEEGTVYITSTDWFLNKDGKPQTPKVYVAAGTLEELEKFNAHGEDGKPVTKPSIQVSYGGVSKFLHEVFGLARNSIVGDAPPGELDPKLGGLGKDMQADMRLKDSYAKKRRD